MTETIVLGGGCFWCVEAIFSRIHGVLEVQSGYANGDLPSPQYEQVCTGDTGHAEVVKVVFDPQKIELCKLLTVFFAIHDPTTINRQGHDVGTQYRSAIYTTTGAQHAIALEILHQLASSHEFSQPLVTELQPLQHFWPAESDHQNYFARHPQQSYCHWVIAPKVQKFLCTFEHLVVDEHLVVQNSE